MRQSRKADEANIEVSIPLPICLPQIHELPKLATIDVVTD